MSFDPFKKRVDQSRIEMADPALFSAAQRDVYDKIVSGKRGKVVGPLRVALHSPELADRWQSFGEFVRFQTDLPTAITELAIITTGRFWNSQVEWVIHSRLALEAGLDVAIIEDIRQAKAPRFESELDALVYDFTREILERGQVSDGIYESLHGAIGTTPLVELTAVIGYYSMVAMTLNVHRVPVPDYEDATPIDCVSGEHSARTTALPPSILLKACS